MIGGITKHYAVLPNGKEVVAANPQVFFQLYWMDSRDAMIDEVAHLLGGPMDADIFGKFVVFCACERPQQFGGKTRTE